MQLTLSLLATALPNASSNPLHRNPNCDQQTNTAMLTKSTIDVIHATAPAVAAHAEQITRVFYARMFAGNPEVRAYFNPAHQHSGEQARALANAVVAYAVNIENLGALGPAVELIAQKHCSLGVLPQHYPIVGKHLLDAVKEVLGDAVTADVLKAWGEAYGFLAQVFIDREAAIYADQAAAPGGWNGYRPFFVDRIVPESRIVSSFYLKPSDGGALPDYLPGQYVTLKLDGESSLTTPRNYSLSDRPGNPYFRISVKRETALVPGAPSGVVSNRLHSDLKVGDLVLLGPPCGVFTLDPTVDFQRPLVFLAGGIGVTPLLAMAKALDHHRNPAATTFVQAARCSEFQALGNELLAIEQSLPSFRLHTRFSDPLSTDVGSGRCHSTGIVDLAFLREVVEDFDAEFYLCGPKPFMQLAIASLTEQGVAADRLHYEFFGPLQPITSAA